MSSLSLRHPEEGALLRYLDGEGSRLEARRVKQHVEACWQCRASLQDLEETMAECVRYRAAVLTQMIPPAPRPWADLTREFERIDSEGQREGFLLRLLQPLRGGAQLRWAATAVTALALVGVLVYELWRTPSVEASTLLQKAVIAAAEHPRTVRHLQIRSQGRQFTRTSGSQAAAYRDSSGVETLFRQAHYDWDDPLSARSFQAWRGGLVSRRDEVSTVNVGGNVGLSYYRIRTVAGEGTLSSATLTLRKVDLWPTRGSFEFSGHDPIEISEMAEQAPDAGAAAATASAETTEHHGAVLPAAKTEAPVVVQSAAAGPAALELQVIAALHRAGADLGDPIEVTRDGGQVVVRATGLPTERQRQIRDALEPLPNVTVRFAELRSSGQPGKPESGETIADAGPSALQAGLETQLGGHAEFERFSTRMFDRSEAAMAQAYALRRLAGRFGTGTESELSASERDLLRGIGREHALALASQIAELDKGLRPFLTNSGGAGTSAERIGATTWQAAAEQVFRSTQTVEKQLAMLLGATPPEGTAASVPSALAAGLANLRADLENCQRLFSKDTPEKGR